MLPAVLDPTCDDLYLGLDLGTSGLKGVVLSSAGTVAASATARYTTHRPELGAAEQSPADWIAAIGSVLAGLRAVTDATRWRGLGLTGMIPTLVPVGRDGAPIGPAITWQDSRADGYGDSLRELVGADALYRLTGQWVDGRYLLPMYLRAAAAEPDRPARITTLLGAKDYLYGWLTGAAATDPSTATGFGCYDLHAANWHSDTLSAAADLIGLAPPALPPVLPSHSAQPLIASVAAALDCPPLPVCLGAADSVLGAYGLGVRRPGQIGYVAGTSNVILGLADRPVLDGDHRFLVTPMAAPEHWGVEMDLLATGDAIRWLAGLTGGQASEASLIDQAATIPPGDAPIALPYFSPGEQGALWDARLYGTFVGLTLRHGPGHLARGLLNGILLESRRCLAVLDETGGFDRELHLGGTSAAHPAFRADLASVSRRRVIVPTAPDAPYSAIGAAQWAALSIDGLDLPVAADPPADGGRGTESDERQASLWDDLWRDYERARLAITSHYHAEP